MNTNPVSTRLFGTLPDGDPVHAWTLRGPGGAEAEILTYGCIIASLKVPDREGRMADVVLGFDRLDPYLERHPYFGAIVGRIAGRVPGAVLDVDGKKHPLAKNNGSNHLHGGLVALDRRNWTAETDERPGGVPVLKLQYSSPDGEEGYPGNVEFRVTYAITAANELLVETEAVADRVTPVSLAQHSYFHLGGEGSGDVSDHVVCIASDAAGVVDDAYTPLGRVIDVTDTPMDFREPRRLGDVLSGLFGAHGDMYRLPWAGGARPAAPAFAARVAHPASGRVMEVRTTWPWVQFYTGAMLSGAETGKAGVAYTKHAGLCLECQGYPGPFGKDGFAEILVHPGRPQRHTTVYAFSTTRHES